MDKEAGNTYQGMNFNVDAYILARQQTEGARYDAVPTTQQGLEESLAAGGEVVLGADIVMSPNGHGETEGYLVAQMSVTENTTLDLGGKTFALNTEETTESLPYTPAMISVMDNTLTIEGEGVIDAEAGYNTAYGINILGGTVVINGGTFYGAMSAVQVQKGTLVINGGFFDLAATIKVAAPQYASYLINCIDAAYKDDSAVVEIKGGTFVNFDPSDDPEGANTSYVADGYTVVPQKKDNGETWYTVVPKE